MAVDMMASGDFVQNSCGRTRAADDLSGGSRAKRRRSHGGSKSYTCKLDGCWRTVFFDSAKKHVHDYCSKSHAKKAFMDGQRTSTTTLMCELPGCQWRVYVDPITSLESRFCTKAHRDQAHSRECVRTGCTRTAWMANTEGPQFCSRGCAVATGAQGIYTRRSCELHGCCEKQLHDRQTGIAFIYCGEDHRVRHEQLFAGVANPGPYVERVFCGSTTGANNFVLSVLSKAHPFYPSLADQFTSKWINPLPRGGVSIERILRVEVPVDVRRKTQDYESIVGNVRRRFHGTSCSPRCSFFADLRGKPCSNADCNVCSICTHGFTKKAKVGMPARTTRTGLRFGKGLYFSSVSGKAHGYAGRSEKIRGDGCNLRCMFVVDVAAGKAYKTQESRLPQSMCPPAGYDSVVAEVGQKLDYDELVVYKEEAAVPTHLIVYSFRVESST